jgi:hypothetical protein
MTIHARQSFPSRWPLTWVALFAISPGCSGRSENGPKLTPVLDQRGFITYRYESSEPPAVASTTRPSVLPSLEQQLYALNQQRQNDGQAYHESRRELEDQRRREQQDQQAYHDAWLRNQREQLSLQREERRLYQQRQSQAFHQQRERAQAEALERDRARQELDAALQNLQQQQHETMFPHHGFGR